MKLEQLGTNFSLMDQEEQSVFFYSYIEKRALDLAEPVTFKRPKKAKGKNLTVTNEALEMLKKLGLV